MSILHIYLLLFGISLICSGIYFWRWHKHIDIAYTMMYLLTPLLTIGYVFMAAAGDLGEMLMAVRIVYLCAIFLELVMTLNILSLCKIRLPKAVTFAITVCGCLLYMGVLTIGRYPYFYKNVSIRGTNADGMLLLDKEYGFMHTLFYVWIFTLIFISLGVLIYARCKIPEASIKITSLLLLTEVVTVFAHSYGKYIGGEFEMAAPSFIISGIIYLIIVDKTCLYDVDDTVIDTLIEQGSTGYLTFDFSHNYLGSTVMAKKLLPQLKVAQVDKPLKNTELHDKVEEWLADFNKDEVSRDLYDKYNGRIYLVRVRYLYDGIRKRGYQIEIFDDTSHREYLASIEAYNQNLKEELAKKNRLIEELREKNH